VELTRRHQVLYCSNACQRAKERRARLAAWLESGQGAPSTHPKHYIRRYLLEQQRGLCDICACVTEWMGHELVFIIDHVDGDSTQTTIARTFD